MRVLTIVHHRNAATGVFADALAAAGAELREWLPHEEEPPSLDGFDAVIVFGADAQVDQEDAHAWLRPEKELIRELLERDTPALGVCFGSQLLAEAAGGAVGPSVMPEVGWREVELTADGRADPLLGFLPARFDGLHYHSYEWLLPPGAVALARSAVCLQAFRLRDRPVWGVQFHPEVTESDFSEWLDDWDDDPDAIRAETAVKIAAWNEVGRELVKRFLAAATAA